MIVRYVMWDAIGVFDVEATVEGRFAEAALSRRGLAFEPQ